MMDAKNQQFSYKKRVSERGHAAFKCTPHLSDDRRQIFPPQSPAREP